MRRKRRNSLPSSLLHTLGIWLWNLMLISSVMFSDMKENFTATAMSTMQSQRKKMTRILLKIIFATTKGANWLLGWSYLNSMILLKRVMVIGYLTFTRWPFSSTKQVDTKSTHMWCYSILSKLLLFYQSEAQQLKWNRGFKKHGGKGKNIILDQELEHCNKTVKTV